LAKMRTEEKERFEEDGSHRNRVKSLTPSSVGEKAMTQQREKEVMVISKGNEAMTKSPVFLRGAIPDSSRTLSEKAQSDKSSTTAHPQFNETADARAQRKYNQEKTHSSAEISHRIGAGAILICVFLEAQGRGFKAGWTQAYPAPKEGGKSKNDVIPFLEVYTKSLCQTREMLVDIIQEYPDEVEHTYIPSCVVLMRCAGCCNDEALECVPTETRNVTMEVMRLKQRRSKHNVQLSFTEHTSCGCRPKAEVKEKKEKCEKPR
ncbi:hypothetical protein DNTS_021017, partial [Danionella cerebrum]